MSDDHLAEWRQFFLTDMPTHDLRVNNTTIEVARPADADPVIPASEALDRAGFDPSRCQLHEDTGEGETFAARSGDHLLVVWLAEHDQVIARERGSD